jgi:uncharacterized XkdX family phage protein
MYGFILNMWVFGRIKEDDVNTFVEKGYITEQEASQILATPQDATADDTQAAE